jgi:hypothetical protein
MRAAGQRKGASRTVRLGQDIGRRLRGLCPRRRKLGWFPDDGWLQSGPPAESSSRQQRDLIGASDVPQ